MRPSLCNLSRLALGVVFLLGVSARSSLGQFTTVIDVPPDAVPASLGSDTQLNLSAGGSIPSSSSQPFQAGSPDGTSTNIEVNIAGGTVGDGFTANAGTTILVEGGTLGEGFTVTGGGQLTVTGGQFASDLTILDGSSLRFRGGLGGDFLGVGGASTAEFSGGSINSVFADTGATVTVEDTTTIDFLSAILGATLESWGGQVRSADVIDNSRVTIDGGTIESLQLDVGSEADLLSGSVDVLGVQFGDFRMSGGELTGELQVNGGFSSAVIRGGDVSGVLSVLFGGCLELIGDSFEIDGVPVDGLAIPGGSVVVPERGGALLTGLLADGSAIELVLNEPQFPGEEGVSLDSTLRLTSVPEPTGIACLLLLLTASSGPSRTRPT